MGTSGNRKLSWKLLVKKPGSYMKSNNERGEEEKGGKATRPGDKKQAYCYTCAGTTRHCWDGREWYCIEC